MEGNFYFFQRINSQPTNKSFFEFSEGSLIQNTDVRFPNAQPTCYGFYVDLQHNLDLEMVFTQLKGEKTLISKKKSATVMQYYQVDNETNSVAINNCEKNDLKHENIRSLSLFLTLSYEHKLSHSLYRH